MIAGLEKISGGTLETDGQRVNDVPPAQNGITPAPARRDRQFNTATTRRKIRKPSHISALNAAAWSPAFRDHRVSPWLWVFLRRSCAPA
tara:strand:+ start:1494 stop:1760 length:267 start_codon:yes stop_codon:yes gene_type:complete